MTGLTFVSGLLGRLSIAKVGIGLAVLIPTIAAGWQTYQVSVNKTKLAECRTTSSELRESITSANNEMLRRVADARRTAREQFESEVEITEPLVRDVLVRLDTLCVPEPAGDTVRGAVPGATGVADGTDSGAGGDRDGGERGSTDRSRFIEALKRDIEYCQAEVTRLSAFQKWARGVSCKDDETC